MEKTKGDLKKNSLTFEKKLQALENEIKEKDMALFELQKAQNQKEAEQYYLSNASLVQTYQQTGKKTEEEDGVKAKKVR